MTDIPSTLRHYYVGDMLPPLDEMKPPFLENALLEIEQKVAEVDGRVETLEQQRDALLSIGQFDALPANPFHCLI